MNDEGDTYLGRCVKNWAAGRQPPADGRERLLSQARQETQEQHSISRGKFRQFIDKLWSYESFGVPGNYRANWYIPPYRRTQLDWTIAPGLRPHQWFMQLAVDSGQPS
jgi:hypothetical protein